MNNNFQIIDFLKSQKQTIATAESLTGGMIGSSFVDISGASKVYKGTLVAYDLSIKENILNISKDILKEDAVNKETAFLMAKNISNLFNSTYGISTTGIAEKYDGRNCQMYYCIFDSEKQQFIEGFIELENNFTRNEVRKIFTDKILEIFNDFLKSR